MAPLRRWTTRIVGEVPVTNRQNETVTTAKMELTRSGDVIARINMSGMSADILREGFSLGEFEPPDEENDETSE